MNDSSAERPRRAPGSRVDGVFDLSVIVPTYNEAPNVAALVKRIQLATAGLSTELIFVDDSTDDTARVIEQAAREASIGVRLIRRPAPDGGLAGAVVVGLLAASSDWCVVMDGDLQHPPELIPALLISGREQDADVVVASRYIKGGSSGGLSGGIRHVVSSAATILTRAMFPRRLRDCTDPMTGFFALRTSSIDLAELRPRGFKILLEILARNTLRVTEEPFVFGDRIAGESKASLREGLRFIIQLAALRFGRLSSFAVIGALGAVANIAIMAALQSIGTWYLLAAIIAALTTIAGNFLLQERFVFHDLRAEGRNVWLRFAQSMAFNLSETAVRTLLLWVLVETTIIPSLVAQAGLIAVGFVLRFIYHSRIVYKPTRTTSIDFDLQSVDAADRAVEIASTERERSNGSARSEPTDQAPERSRPQP
jgi:dolichol-phosphate mannosyltransferase